MAQNDFIQGPTGGDECQQVCIKSVDTGVVIPVVITGETTGTPVIDEKTVVNLGAGLTDDHIYTAVGTIFQTSSVYASASGLIKMEVFVSGVSIYVGFNSNGNNNIYIAFTEDVNIPIASTIKISITNREAAAQNVYSTIAGEQLPP